MIKNLLRLLASSATFVALVLVANIAISQPSSASASLITTEGSTDAVVNLNVMSPLLKSAEVDETLSLNHLGCSCAVCTQGIQSNN